MAATEKAILAGGCFWGVQDLIRKLDGVSGTRVGYTGGDTPNATYRNHGSHAEAIEILFDPERISYRDLLEFFFQIHDPTTKNRQGNDVGASYRSAIYYVDDEQRRIAHDTIAERALDGVRMGPLNERARVRPLRSNNSPLAPTRRSVRTAIGGFWRLLLLQQGRRRR